MQILETERLILRHPVLSDVDGIFVFYSDPEVRRYFPDGTLTYQETREEVEWYLNGHPRHPELGLWATVDKATSRLIGRGLLRTIITVRGGGSLSAGQQVGLGREAAAGDP
ncbi:MAG: GNAT family N-acetyltransferase [Caldilineae bacterium]|nr:GNAT family N-acetyltransferase [Caldilineae bacterium]